MTYNSANYHSLTIEQALARLNTTPLGLGVGEVEKRLKEYGKNKFPEPKRRGALIIFLLQLKNPLVYFLGAGVLIALFLNETADATIIGLAILVSAIFGFVQEYKSEKAVAELNRAIHESARVIRNGEEVKIDAELLVPGDIIILQDGYKVPADARLIEEKNFEVDESVLTGESVPESKILAVQAEDSVLADRKNMVYMGTLVVRGRGKAIVIATGIHTEFGKIAKSLTEVERVATPLQRNIEKLTKHLSIGIIGVVGGLFILGIMLGKEFREMLLTSIALLAAAVPEGLLVSVTAVLVIGARRLARDNALVRHMGAVETVGKATVICSDKTGTITEGRMEMDKIIPKVSTVDERMLLRIGMLTADSRVENPHAVFTEWRLTGDWTTRSILHASLDAGFADEYLKRDAILVDDLPFESDLGYRAVLTKELGIMNQELGTGMMYFLGVPEKLIARSALSQDEKKNLLDENISMSQSGFRVLGVAAKKVVEGTKIAQISNYSSDLDFYGFFALKDPIRESVHTSIAEAREAGVRVMMLTGDNKYTAGAIASELGLPVGPGHLTDSTEAAKLSEEDLKKKVKDITVFARVTPSDKLRIIQSLQSQGEVVAMTGDGVNDAPALRRADIGIALGSGTSISREVADVVLLDNNFKTIVKAIEEGRGIFDNIKKVVAFLLHDSFIEILLVAVSILLSLPIPILPAQILWVNLIEDTFPSFALALEPKEPGAMQEKPQGFGGQILDRQVRAVVIGFGLVSAALLFGLYFFLLSTGRPLAELRTMIFIGLAIDSLFTIFAMKSLRRSIWQMDLFNNKYLWMFFFGGTALLFVPVYVPIFQKFLRTVPLRAEDWILLFALAIVNLALLEVVKLILIRRRYHKNLV